MSMEKRRSANYGASIWDDEYVQSLTSPYQAKEYSEQIKKLKDRVRLIIEETDDELDRLELIDILQRLDISCHFEDQILKMLKQIYINNQNHGGVQMENASLYHVSLKFRLLRQHGYQVPEGVFGVFLNKEGNFSVGHADNVKGILSLYEASYLSMEGESILDLARDFAACYLKKTLEEITEGSLADQIRHALELPPHWRVQKLEAKWFINAYESRFDANHTLLQLAKLDFNTIQAQYQDEIKQLSRWFKETGFGERFSFARHRLVESFFWPLGSNPEPHFGYSRMILTKIAVLVTIMDDTYDVYGTLDELELLTNTIERWDINSLDQLPEYMRIYFLALFNFVNETAYDILKDQGFNVILNLRQLWAGLSKAYYLEARWYHGEYFPSLNEYLNNGCITIGGPIYLFHCYFAITNPINWKEVQWLEQNPGIIHWPSLIVRLTDDLETSSDEMKRGDVPKSIQCHMHDTGCSEEEARKHIKFLNDVTWKRMNKDILMGGSPYKTLTTVAMNLARISQCYYQHGDGYGIPYGETKKNLISLIVEPIPMP